MPLTVVAQKEKPCHYNAGFLCPAYSGPSHLCSSNKYCSNGRSMCRYPYYPSNMSRLYFNTPPPRCEASRYLYNV